MLSIFKSIPTYMDYGGQKLAEQIFQGITIVFAVIGFIYGMIVQQFGWTIYIVLTGFTISCLLTLPPWPIYRKNPLKWLPALPESPGDTREKSPENQKKQRKYK